MIYTCDSVDVYTDTCIYRVEPEKCVCVCVCVCVCGTLLRSICPPAVTYPHELFVELPNGLQSLCLDDPGLLEHLLLLLEQALDTDNKDSQSRIDLVLRLLQYHPAKLVTTAC